MEKLTNKTTKLDSSIFLVLQAENFIPINDFVVSEKPLNKTVSISQPFNFFLRKISFKNLTEKNF